MALHLHSLIRRPDKHRNNPTVIHARNNITGTQHRSNTGRLTQRRSTSHITNAIYVFRFKQDVPHVSIVPPPPSDRTIARQQNRTPSTFTNNGVSSVTQTSEENKLNIYTNMLSYKTK